MGAFEIERFLSDLAVNPHVAASTQNQAFNMKKPGPGVRRPLDA